MSTFLQDLRFALRQLRRAPAFALTVIVTLTLAMPEIYSPAVHGSSRMQFALRTTLPAAMLEPPLRRVVTQLDASTFVSKLSTLQTSLDSQLLQPRLNATLIPARRAAQLDPIITLKSI